MNRKGTDIPLMKTKSSFFPVPQPAASTLTGPPTLPTGPFSIQPNYVTLGLQRRTRKNGLVGSLRNFQMFNVILTEDQLKNTPFTYLHPQKSLLMQVVLQSNQILDTDNLATGREATSDGLSRQPAAAVRNDYDFMAQKFCYTNDYPNSYVDTGDYEYA